jgi:hypothetical protein
MIDSQKPSPLSHVTIFLNWVISIVESFIIFGIAFVIFYGGYLFVFGSDQNPQRQRMIALVAIASQNWKGFLLILIPLFYRPIRMFLEEVEEAFGMKRPLSGEAAKMIPTLLEKR